MLLVGCIHQFEKRVHARHRRQLNSPRSKSSRFAGRISVEEWGSQDDEIASICVVNRSC